jgi:hypothetical protein
MKFTKLAVLLFAIVAFVSCKKEEEKPAEVIENTTVIEETVIVQDTVKETEKDGTSVKVSGEGVEVDSKNLDVEIKK